ncbi:two component, sigma54 specific, transcriptional regulator, Fis family [Geobacter metallireducens RCH3]|uniref:Sigma-54-dependent transcriptional response regulator n=1 Tax=Geobacter metallireducens (strain ATCC 53774 / DSM 7210 / GS-15) TaxID=269799 RepID=Q39X21_GEOMG|nr:sigma-54 dependent transcriptional regulator [Geobacter metallireducens]ABB31203.1 sigma-54-dependent transcriptional response regulator [Geobacter metallireducens GS-15]EHP84600.1 two component, sigma54 specific, transcriptional regulator, Fis family [Geobacter metallireducens RCH3]
MKQRVLVIDDEENLRHMLGAMLRKNGYHADEAADGEQALAMAGEHPYDFIICDIRMPVLDGLGFLRRAQEAGIGGTIIMMSAYGTIDTALQCMKEGAYDYVSKPFKNDEILLVLKKAEERERLKTENCRLRAEVAREYSFGAIVSRNPRMREIFELIRKVCDVKTSVLVLGESGTGKELVARAIHHNGSRRDAPFVAVNCGAIPEHLLESELFGHVRGAFTDAASDRTGLFEEAHGGTLFLDEIGEMPPSLQVKLLRVLQEGEVRRVGAERLSKVDVRVISATSRDLEREVAEGHFREDLFFRLNVVSITLPPLRERLEDVPLLAGHFLNKHGTSLGRPGARVSPEALRLLSAYAWPGNVRELENCIERALILGDGDVVGPGALPDGLRGGGAGWAMVGPDNDNLSIKKAEERLEREFIRRALEKTGGNRTHAARILEISHRALLYKLKEYDME